ncbi:MAG: hypothetical protein LQ348_003294 [Seirophora lacunosa]|nr:MAG: hypothetical protein LQ348_003294 [Seirophora lacunosa]
MATRQSTRPHQTNPNGVQLRGLETRDPKAPSNPRKASQLPSRSQVISTTIQPVDRRAASKIALPSRRHGNVRDVPSGLASVDKKSSGAAVLRQRDTCRTVSTGLESCAKSAEVPSEEVRQLQGRLLQLHLLHSISAEIHQQWRESAKNRFNKQFDELVERHAEIAEIARQTHEFKNRSALVDWGRHIEAPELARRVGVLSMCVQQIYEDSEAGGKYSQTVASFEAWFARAREVQESRSAGLPNSLTVPGYVEEIGAGWQNDVDSLQRRLSTLTGDLRTLGSASADSSLGQLLVLLQDLVMDMLAEVDCIRSIEYEIVAQEEAWMESQIRCLSLKVHNEMGGPRKKPSKCSGYG